MTGDGPICDGCGDAMSLATAWESIASKAVGASLACLGFGLLSYLINPLMLFTVISASSGIGALFTLRKPETRQALGGRLALVVIASVVGLVAVSLQLLFVLFVVSVLLR